MKNSLLERGVANFSIVYYKFATRAPSSEFIGGSMYQFFFKTTKTKFWPLSRSNPDFCQYILPAIFGRWIRWAKKNFSSSELYPSRYFRGKITWKFQAAYDMHRLWVNWTLKNRFWCELVCQKSPKSLRKELYGQLQK